VVAEFNADGPEIAYFKRSSRRGSRPSTWRAVRAACFIPYLQAGLDVDGCDISPDMLALCRDRAEREGLSPNLYQQAMHELDLPRRYRAIYVCGGFGSAGTETTTK
jgi:SAM-dependent methyltransferase